MTNERVLTILSNVVMLVAGAAIIGQLGYRYINAPAPLVRYAAGEQVERIDTVAFDKADKTLLLYVASHCQFCSNSMDFYRELAELDAADGDHLQMVFIGNESTDVLSTYLTGHQLGASRIATVPTGKGSKLAGTPTLLLVNRDGVVERLWVGQQPDAVEREIVTLLRG